MEHRGAVVAVILGGAVLLGGCASPQWTRSDSTPAEAIRDERACHALAEYELSLHPPGLNGSLMELYGQNFRPASRMSAPQIGNASGPMFDIDPVHQMLDEDRIADDCMRAKGYMLKELPTESRPVEIPDCRKCPVT